MEKLKKLFILSLLIVLFVSFGIALSRLNANTDVTDNMQFQINLKDKKISILGDSISTFDGVSNNANVNSTIANNIFRYPQQNLDITNVSQTWWKKVEEHFSAQILVNNSWVGSEILGADNSSAYLTRAEQLHTNAGVNPDIILVYMGINDVGHNTGSSGNFVSKSQILNSDGSYIKPTTFSDAYAIVVDKITNKYTNANLFLFTLPANTYVSNSAFQNNSLRENFNSQIRKISSAYNVGLVDLTKISNYNPSIDCNDGLHPNPTGMTKIANFVIDSLTKYYS